jgi:hypothetical protein
MAICWKLTSSGCVRKLSLVLTASRSIVSCDGISCRRPRSISADSSEPYGRIMFSYQRSSWVLGRSLLRSRGS